MSARPLFLAGEARTTDHILEICSPYSGDVVSQVCQADPEHLEEALAAAEAAAPVMAALPLHERATILERARDLTAACLDALARTIVDEAGKPITQARGEITRALDTFTDAAVAARSLQGTVQPLDSVPGGEGRIALIKRVPIGPIAAITPFNFPFNLVVHKLAPAIAAGCPVVLKPASQTPTAALWLANILDRAGLPKGALSVLPMDTEHAGPLTTDRRLRFLSFTGSAAVGWALKGQAKHMPVALELGGIAGNYVAGDADLDLAVERLAATAFGYAGQSCISTQRILLDASIAERFTAAFLAHVASDVPAGDPADPATVVGPVIRASDADRIMAWIDEARQGGATVHTGGTRQGQVIAPTVLSDVPRDAKVRCEEVFGPVVLLETVTTDEEAFRSINDTPYGLQAGIFTQSIDRVMRAWDTLEVGGIMHNEASAFRVDAMPYGGVKDSGIGREGPRHMMDELTESRLLVLHTP